jgi:mercuric ion binding protein
MKTTHLFLSIIAIFIFAASASAQPKNVKATIKVYGNCTMCKKRIETALDTKGIKQAMWDPKTKELQVVYVPGRITELEIHQIVAAVGHDTDKVKATDEAYAELPFCCLYRDHDHSVGKVEGHDH